MNQMSQKRFSIYFITVSMALGLGNIWRFPYLIHEFGSGAFLSIYGLLALFIGVPLVLTEVMLGKYHSARDYGSSGKILKSVFFDKKVKWIWWLPATMSLFVLSYYALISGWLLHYVSQLAFCLIFKQPFSAENAFLQLINKPWLQVLLTSAHIILTFLLMNKGEHFKVSRLMGLILPVFVAFAGYIVYNYYTRDELFETARFLLYPNFNRLTPASLNYALGHMLFTLSLGFGTLLSFGKSLKADASTTTIASRIGFLDSVTSVLMAFVLFPMVITLGYVGSGSEILFSVVPYYFNSLGLGLGATLLFYLLVYLTSLTAGLGLMESIAMNLYEMKSYSRVKSITVTCNLVFFLSILIVLSHYFTKYIGVLGYRNMVLLVDDILINFILPISVILISVSSYKFLDRKFVQDEFMRDESPSSWRFFLYWKFIIKYGFPLVFIISIIVRFT